MSFLGSLYESGTGVPADINQALKYFNEAADKGDAESMFHLGTYHMTISRDYSKATFNFLRAGEKGHPEAFFRLGYMESHGWGCPVDLAKSKQFYARADSLGFSYARQQTVLKERGE